jgi:probable inactive protein kinase-like protein SgK071
VQAVCDALSRHAADAAVLEAACGAMRNLAVGGNGLLAAQEGALESVIAALRDHARSASLAAQAAGCLWALAVPPQNKAGAVSCGAVEACTAVLLRHPRHAGVNQQACGALWSLCMEPTAQAIAGECGAIEALADSLRAFPASAAVQEAGCGALANIGWSQRELQDRARRCGALELCAAAIDRFPQHKGVQRYAALSVGRLTPGKR